MDSAMPSPPASREDIMEPRTLQGPSELDRATDQSSSLFSGFAGFLVVLLVMVLCTMWNWKKWKKRRRSYRRVVGLPSLNRPRPRQRAKNIYDHLPRRQDTLGRPQSRSSQMVSTESLLSGNSSSPALEHPASQADSVHGACTQTSVYSVAIYDNARAPPTCETPTLSALDVNGGISGNCPSTSSEDSLDYVNVPTAVEMPEPLAPTSSSPESFPVMLGAQEPVSPEERDQEDNWDCSSVWTPASESSDSDGDDSSQSSSDYVNMERLEEGAGQGKPPWVGLQCCRDYENIPPAAHQRNQQQQAKEEMTLPSPDLMEGGTNDSGSHGQLAVQSGRFLALEDQVTHQPAAQSGDNAEKHGEEMPDEGCHDYENVQEARLGVLAPTPAPS